MRANEEKAIAMSSSPIHPPAVRLPWTSAIPPMTLKYSQTTLDKAQTNSVLAANLPRTRPVRDVGHVRLMSSAPVRRSSANDRMATTGTSTSSVLAMLE